MTVSGKMIEDVDKLEDVCGSYISRDKETLGERIPCIDDAEKVAQTAINAAWTRFDPEDESTYPNSEHSPEGHRWVVNYVADNGKFNKYFRRRKFVDPKLWKTVFEYAAAENLQSS